MSLSEMLVVMEMEATKMAFNQTSYNNLTPAASLDKATLNKMVWRSLNLQGSFNYERMQANAGCTAFCPACWLSTVRIARI